MHQVNIQIETKSYDFELLSSWEEMTPKVWKKLHPHLESGNIFTPEVLKTLTTRGKFPKTEIPPGAYTHLYSSINWLLKSPCTHPPFPYLKIKNKKYHLPAPRLENLTIIEFAFLDMCWQLSRFFESRGDQAQSNEWLTKLTMYMARPIDRRINPQDPETYMGDRREKFNTAVIEQRWPLFREIDPGDRFGCLWFFLGCKAHIHQKYKGKLWFDTHDDEGNEIIGVQKDDKPQPFRWIEICRKLAGGKFGNLRETQFTGLYEVLEELVGQRGNYS